MKRVAQPVPRSALVDAFRALAKQYELAPKTGVLALPNIGDTQSHAHELVTAKALKLGLSAGVTPNAVFWTKQSHKRAFAKDGSLIDALALHWMGDRRVITRALKGALALIPSMKLKVPATDRAAFVVRAATQARLAAEPSKALPKGKPSDELPDVHDAPAVRERLYATKLTDSPEVRAWLLTICANGDDRDLLRVLDVFYKLGEREQEKVIAQHRKKGTLDAYFATFQPSACFPPQVLASVVRRAPSLAERVDESSQQVFFAALMELFRAEHAKAMATAASAAGSSSWRARAKVVAVALAESTPQAFHHGLLALMDRLVHDKELNVATEACKAVAVLRGQPLAGVRVGLLEDAATETALRERLVFDLANTSPADLVPFRARLKRLLQKPNFSTSPHQKTLIARLR